MREATAPLRLPDTAEHGKKLAEAFYADMRFDETQTLYETALEGAHADDPGLMMGMALSQFGLQDDQGLCETLDRLPETTPDFEIGGCHTLYAHSGEAVGDLDQAAVEYESLSGHYLGGEARCRYALLLQRLGQVKRGPRALRIKCDIP